MKELYNKYKREIWIGVVVSLITGAILKFGDWLVRIVPTIGSSIFETLSNIIYSLAATHTDNLLLRIILLGGFSVMVGGMAKQIFEGLKFYNKIKRLEKQSKKLSSATIAQIEQEVLQEINEQEEQASTDTVKDIVLRGKRIGKNTISLVVIIAFSYLFITFFITTPMSLSNAFQQDVVKIAPYVEDSAVRQLESDWVCMRSKSDYDIIYKRINEVKEEHDLP